MPATDIDDRISTFRSRLRSQPVGWLTTPDAFYVQLLNSLKSIRPRVFLSYSRRNEEIARFLQQQLRREDIHCWRDVTDIPGSADWAAALEQALDQMDILVVLVTAESVGSEWVAKECTAFLERGKRVIPYIVDSALQASLPTSLKKLEYLQKYQMISGIDEYGIHRLVKDLRPLLAL